MVAEGCQEAGWQFPGIVFFDFVLWRLTKMNRKVLEKRSEQEY